MTKKRRAPQTKPLTRHQAWLVVATAFGAQIGAQTGICLMLARLRRYKLISKRMHDKMRNELGTKRPPNAFAYWWPLDERGAAERVAVATKLAKALKR